MIYLDHAATTPLAPDAREAMQRAWDAAPGNPASAHAAGRRARQILEDAREQIAALLEAAPQEVVFTSGATEANNLALFGLAGDPPGHILAGPTEHPCVTEPLERLAARGFVVEFLPVNRDGIVDVAAIETMRRPDTRLVTLQLVNHETGAIQPVTAHDSILVHTDAAQAAGKLPVRFRSLGVTALTVSAHKFGGPPGVGALLLRRGVALRPMFHGGHQQQGRRPGTEPVALIAGMAAALDVACHNMDQKQRHCAELRERFLSNLEPAAPLVLNGAAHAVPSIINVSFPGCAADRLLIALDLAGVACSTGSACSSGSLLPSPVLRTMNVPDDVLRSAMRFSFGPSTTIDDLDQAAKRIVAAVRQLRGN